MSKDKKIGKPPKPGIESVTTNEKSVEVMFTGVRLIFDGISEVQESVFEGTTSHRFSAGLEIPEGKALDELIRAIQTTMKNLSMKGWAADVALAHFKEKKFKNATTPGFKVLYPSAPAEELDDGSFRAKGKLFVNPSHDAFYAGCYVDAKVAFVANTRGGITVKDYLNAIKLVADGKPISGAVDPWGDSQKQAPVTKVRRAPEEMKSKGKKKTKKAS